MRPVDRENKLYQEGKKCGIAKPEQILFEYLERFVRAGSHVLDIGCGSGEITQKIVERGYEVTGLDFSPVAVQRARELGLDCRTADLDSGIPVSSNTVHAVWAGDVIEHVFDPILVLKEVHRVLVPGGTLLLTVPYDLRLGTRLRILFGHSYQEAVYRTFGQYKHHTFFSIPLLRYMLSEASLQIQQTKYVIRPPRSKAEFISNSKALMPFCKTIAVRAVAEKNG